MGKWHITPINGKDEVGTTALASCMAVVCFIKVKNKHNQSRECIALSHFDSASSCESARFNNVDNQLKDTELVIKKALAEISNYLEDRSSTLENIDNIMLFGGVEEPICQELLVGISELKKDWQKTKDNEVQEFVKKVDVLNIGLYPHALTFPDKSHVNKMSAACNVFAEMQHHGKQVHIEYRVILEREKNFEIPFAYYKIDIVKKTLEEELYLENVLQSKSHNFDDEEMLYFNKVYTHVTKSFRTITISYKLIPDEKNFAAISENLSNKEQNASLKDEKPVSNLNASFPTSVPTARLSSYGKISQATHVDPSKKRKEVTSDEFDEEETSSQNKKIDSKKEEQEPQTNVEKADTPSSTNTKSTLTKP